MSEILGKIFGFGDQIKRNLRDAYKDPAGYLEGAIIENQKNWEKNPEQMAMGFFNPVPLGTMGNFVLRKELGDAITNLSRRDFLKKSAGIAGGSVAASIPGSKLLQKFAPEERALAKEVAVEAAPKYKYNSLKEYLDDVSDLAERKADAFTNQYGGNWRDYHPEYMRGQLLGDELKYTNAKNGKRLGDVLPGDEEALNAFSPQAKKEMKDAKEHIEFMQDIAGEYNSSWADELLRNRHNMGLE